MSIMIFAVLGLIVVAAFMIVPRISGGFGLGANAKAGGGGSKLVQANSNGGSNIDLDVSGENSCACANGVCKGNCSEMEQIDLENFDPLDWVQQNS